MPNRRRMRSADHPKILSLCSGVGGLDLGVRAVLQKSRTIAYVEREAYCCAVLAQRMEEGSLDKAPIWADVRTFDGESCARAVDVVIGGYPCQPFSIAGDRKGESDPRHLWPSILRIIRESEPRLCFLENVPHHLRLGFRSVAEDLRRLGYQVAASLWTAQEVGASHKRERLFIMAYSESRPGSGQKDKADSSASAKGGGSRLTSGGNTTSLFAPGPEDSRWPDILALDPTIEPALCRMANGMAYRMDRLRATGNGVVPLQAACAFRELAETLGIAAFLGEKD